MNLRTLALASLVASLSAPAAPGLAAGNPDAVSGLVSEQCTACHEIPGYKPRYEKAEGVNPPPFQDIADNPDRYPVDQIRTFLQHPHYPMGKFTLSPSDIENLIAFIENLKKP